MDTILPPVAASLILIGVSATVFGTIVRTFHLGITVTWVEETTRFSIIWGTLLLMGTGFRKGLHTQLTLLEERLRGKAKYFLVLLLQIISFVFFGILVIGGIQFALNGRAMTSAGLGISMMIPYLSIPVCSAITEIELLMLIAESLLHLYGRAPEADLETEAR